VNSISLKIICLIFIFSPWVNINAHGGFHLFQKDYKCSSSPFTRDIYVYLPKDYSSHNQIKYPVLIMHDGQNLFDPNRAYLGQTWNAERTLNNLIDSKKIAPVVVIAIDNTKDRVTEYTFDQDPSVNVKAGKAYEYLSCILFDLLPLVHRYVLISDKREDIAILGSSLGGLVSIYAGHEFSQLIGMVGALSPSIWWNNRSIGKIVKDSFTSPSHIYLDSGDTGGESPSDITWLKNLYLNPNNPKDIKVKMVIQQGANHSEKFWAQRFPIALEFLFPQKKEAE
jgi:predicted alpha/beta superfamily hydrolase